jgi:hypothetical protein
VTVNFTQQKCLRSPHAPSVRLFGDPSKVGAPALFSIRLRR